jgi:hypothetical protein
VFIFRIVRVRLSEIVISPPLPYKFLGFHGRWFSYCGVVGFGILHFIFFPMCLAHICDLLPARLCHAQYTVFHSPPFIYSALILVNLIDPGLETVVFNTLQLI